MRSQPAALLVHGFTGSPHELQALGSFFCQSGYAVSLPILRGHGTNPDELRNVKPSDWLHALEQEYRTQKLSHKRVVLVGISFGGSLALALAARERPDAVVCFGSPVRMRYHKPVKALLQFAHLFRQDIIKPSSGPFADEVIPGYTQRCYQRIPIQSMLRVYQFLETVMTPSVLRRVCAPLLAIQGTHDPIISPWSAEQIVGWSSSSTAVAKRWRDRYHLIVQGERKYELYHEVAKWLREHL